MIICTGGQGSAGAGQAGLAFATRGLWVALAFGGFALGFELDTGLTRAGLGAATAVVTTLSGVGTSSSSASLRLKMISLWR